MSAALGIAVAARRQVAKDGNFARLRRLATTAEARNPVDLPDLGAAGPTLTMLGTTGTSGLTQSRTVAANPALFACYGGPRYNVAGTRWSALSVTTAANTYRSAIQRWSFITDSVDFDVVIFGATPGVFNGFRVMVDGQYVSRSMTVPAVNSATQYFNIDWTAVSTTPRLRRYDIEFSGVGGNSMIGLNLLPADIVQPVPVADRYRIAVFGDSITEGTGATVVGGNYAFQAGYLLGGLDMDICPMAIGGTGYSNPGSNWKFSAHLDDLLRQPVDEVWFVGGVNDTSAFTSTLQADALATFQGARSRLPDTPIIVWGCFVQAAATLASNNLRETTIKAAFDQWADPNSLHIPMQTNAYPPQTGYSDVTTGNTARYNSGDGTHPTQPGHDMLGRWFAEQRRAVLAG